MATESHPETRHSRCSFPLGGPEEKLPAWEAAVRPHPYPLSPRLETLLGGSPSRSSSQSPRL